MSATISSRVSSMRLNSIKISRIFVVKVSSLIISSSMRKGTTVFVFDFNYLRLELEDPLLYERNPFFLGDRSGSIYPKFTC